MPRIDSIFIALLALGQDADESIAFNSYELANFESHNQALNLHCLEPGRK
jgi:hypothetical protein